MKAIGFAGYSGSGKTTLLERVIPALTARGLKVSVLKHAHHSFDIDKPGKDSFRHREAGATEVAIVSARRWVMMHESRGEAEPSMEAMLTHFAPCDLVLVEGYKFGELPKIEVARAQFQARSDVTGGSAVPDAPMFLADPRVVAVATDDEAALRRRVGAQTARLDALERLDLNDPEGVAAFIVRYFGFFDEPLTA